jgi:hypothetical protein
MVKENEKKIKENKENERRVKKLIIIRGKSVIS